MNKELSPQEFIRLANNFYTANNLPVNSQQIAIDSHLLNYIATNRDKIKKKYKIALCSICLNPHYWEYMKTMVEGVRQFFLPGHDVDILFWSDIPKVDNEVVFQQAEEQLKQMKLSSFNGNYSIFFATEAQKIGFNPLQASLLLNLFGSEAISKVSDQMISVEIKGIIERAKESAKVLSQMTVFPLEPIEWPMPTLMRFHTFLQQEEKLKEYDYVFYCDVDMKFMEIIGDEILAEGLIAAQHPMYALRKEYNPPYEPNSQSTSYIPRPGVVLQEGGMPRFMPLYFAGGFQGGKTEDWIKAMKKMKEMIDHDLNKINYIPIWNDETVWNRYLFDNPPAKVLTPSFIYPDSLIEEYYKPIWGINYPPKLMTLTKKFSTTPAGGQAVQQIIQQMKPLQK